MLMMNCITDLEVAYINSEDENQQRYDGLIFEFIKLLDNIYRNYNQINISEPFNKRTIKDYYNLFVYVINIRFALVIIEYETGLYFEDIWIEINDTIERLLELHNNKYKINKYKINKQFIEHINEISYDPFPIMLEGDRKRKLIRELNYDNITNAKYLLNITNQKTRYYMNELIKKILI